MLVGCDAEGLLYLARMIPVYTGVSLFVPFGKHYQKIMGLQAIAFLDYA